MRKREIKVRCLEDHTVNVQAIPNSTDLLAEAGCGHVLLLDGATLETKHELTANVPRGEKLWSSGFVMSPDGKRVALAITYETRRASRQVLSIVRTSDWQEEGKWLIGKVEDGSWHSTFGSPRLFSADGQRLVGWGGHGFRILRLPSGGHESDIDINWEGAGEERGAAENSESFLSKVFRLSPGMADHLIVTVPTNPDEILLLDSESGGLWTIHLKDGARERQAQLEDWPQLKTNYRGGVSPDGSWICAPTSDPVREDAPAFAVWSTTTGKVLARGDVLSFSDAEKRSAELQNDTISTLMQGIHSECQVAPDGKYVRLRVEFGKLAARSRIYQVVFDD